MKKTLLALAMSLAAASGAHAAWDTGVTSDLFTGNGELILSVWDSVTQNSYAQDLGITYNQLVAGYSGTINLNSAALSVFSNTANLSSLQYSVLAASNKQYEPNFDAALTNAGFITTIAPNQGQLQLSNVDALGRMDNVWVKATEYSNALGFDTSPDQNPVKTVTSGGIGYAYSPTWQSYIETTLAKDLSGGNGETSQLWLQSFADNDGTVNLQRLLANVTLNITSTSAGSLTFAGSAPAVPVPAAAWLLGSALAGLGSIARKRRQAV